MSKKLDVTTGKAVNYEYDSLDRLIHSYQTDNDVVQQRTEHLYDTENRLTSQSWQLGDTLYQESYKYNANDGSLTSVNLDGMVGYAYLYDSLKRLNAQYSWLYGRFYTYRTNNGNQTTQIASIDYTKRDGGTSFKEFNLGYEYDKAGNITKITGKNRTEQSASYTYDSQNQLTKEVNTSGTYNYTYDTYGNIRSVSGAASHTYTYGDSEWLDLLTAYDGKSITYDAIGNPAVWHNGTGDWNLSWDNGRQLTEATKGSHIVSYTYDLAGIRNSKTVDGVTYNYITQNGQVVRQTWGSHALDIIYDNTGKPYALNYDGIMYYYVLNLQGDVIAIVTTWGETYGTYTYDAWGNVISQSGSIASINPIRYRGYYYDSESGLYYLGSRYYDPAVKRFINADGATLAVTNSGELTDKNYFAYCNNNPVMQKDDDGELGHIAVAALVGGLISGVADAVLQVATTGKLDLKQTAIAAGSGAISAACSMIPGMNMAISVAVNAGLGAGSYAATEAVNGRKVTAAGVAWGTLSGAVAGVVGTKFRQSSTESLKKATDAVIDRGMRRVTSGVARSSKSAVKRGFDILSRGYSMLTKYGRRVGVNSGVGSIAGSLWGQIYTGWNGGHGWSFSLSK